jgi:hypothetical protein
MHYSCTTKVALTSAKMDPTVNLVQFLAKLSGRDQANKVKGLKIPVSMRNFAVVSREQSGLWRGWCDFLLGCPIWSSPLGVHPHRARQQRSSSKVREVSSRWLPRCSRNTFSEGLCGFGPQNESVGFHRIQRPQFVSLRWIR